MARTLPIAVLLLVVLSPPNRGRAAEVGETLAGSVPSGALAFFETAGLADLIRQVRGSEVFQSVLASDDFKKMQATDFFEEAASARKLAEFVLRMSVWQASEKLLGGRLALAAYPAGVGKDPHVLLLVRPAKPSEWLKRRVRFAPLVRIGLKRIGRKEFGAHVNAYRTRGDRPTYFGLHDGWIAIATEEGLLQQTVAMQEPGGGVAFEKPEALRADPVFRSMSERMGEDHLARAFLSMAQLVEATGDNLGLPREIGDPVLALFLGGVVEVVDISDFAGITLDYDDKRVLLKAGIDARADELGEEFRIFFTGAPEGGLPDPPQVPGYIGGFSLYRPFGEWSRQQDTSVQAALLPWMRAFEAGVGSLLLGNEGVVGDSVTFVAAHAEDGGVDPSGIRLPGFAFVVDLDAGEDPDAALEELFAAVLAEIDAGREAVAEWELGSAAHARLPMRVASRPGDTMRPALVRLGGRAVLSSSRSLCERVVKALQAGGLPHSHGDLAVDLRPTELSTFFAANQEAYEAELVRAGRSPEQAKIDYANIAKLMAGLKSFRVESGSADGSFEFTARGELR